MNTPTLVSETDPTTPSDVNNMSARIATRLDPERRNESDITPHRAIPSTRGLILSLIALCLAELLVVMDNTIVNVAVPTFGRELSASTTQLQWIVDAYTLAFASLLLPAGKLGDRLGRRLTLTAGLLGFAIVSVVTALATTLTELIALRAALGMCAALIFPATLSLITTTFQGSQLKSMAIGLWAATSGVGIALGPIIGGVLLKYYTWPAIFWINVPIAVVAIPAIWFLVSESTSQKGHGFDFGGAIGAVLAVGSLVWAIIEGPHKGWHSMPVLVAFAAAAVGSIALIRWEMGRADPLINITLFQHREFSASAFAICVAFFGLFGFIFAITMFFQGVRGYSALGTGVATLPFAAVMAALSPAATTLAKRIGSATVVAGGLIVMGSGFALVTTAAATCSYWGVIVPAMVLMAAGLALVQGPATSALMAVAPLDQAGAASAVNDTTREVGGTLGVALLGSVLASGFGSNLTSLTADLHLSAPALAAARSSIEGALTVAEELPAALSSPLRQAAQTAFMQALHSASWVAAGVAWLGAVIAFVALPRRRSDAP